MCGVYDSLLYVGYIQPFLHRAVFPALEVGVVPAKALGVAARQALKGVHAVGQQQPVPKRLKTAKNGSTRAVSGTRKGRRASPRVSVAR